MAVGAGAGDECAQCRVCGRDTGLRGIADSSDGTEACDRLLYDCFGLKVSDPSYKICGQCTDLIRTSHKFKEMVSAALCHGDQVSLESSIADQLSFEEKLDYSESEERVFKKKVAARRKPQPLPKKPVIKKTIVICTVCRQKYPMLSADEVNFVCSRCKIRKSNDRTVACVKCGQVLQASQMRQHLEMHAKTDLKGRCRLRSLPKKPSKAQTQTADISKKQRRQHWLHCKSCAKKFPTTQNLADHMRMAHGEYLTFVCSVCGKDMRTKDFLDKHMKSHERTTLFECDKCGKIFKTSFVFQRHYIIHKQTLAA